MPSQRITEVSVTHLPVFFRRELGKNAYGDNIGSCMSEWLVRARTDGGLEGLTIANRYMRTEGSNVAGLIEVLRRALIGRSVDEFLELEGEAVVGVKPGMRRVFRRHGWLSTVAFDLLARARGVSCIDLLGGRKRDRVAAYDTTMYFQDLLHPEAGSAKCVEGALEAKAAGYRQLKIKVGRGGRWMLPEPGMRRDVEVVLAIRDAVGPDFTLMVDGNFGYDGHLDHLEEFFRQTAEARLFWLEELVSADLESYRAVRRMQARYAPDALLVCGEVDREPISDVFSDLIDQGLIDGYQPDLVSTGYAGWREIENRLAGTGVRSIPHNFGNGRFGTRAGLIFGASSESFVTLEDEGQFDHVYLPDGFTFHDGAYSVPDVVGLGLEVNVEKFARDHGAHEVVIGE